MVVNTAIPSAPPICCTAFCTPDARLAFSPETPCSDALVMAGKQRPAPKASMIMLGRTSAA